MLVLIKTKNNMTAKYSDLNTITKNNSPTLVPKRYKYIHTDLYITYYAYIKTITITKKAVF